LIRSFQLHAEAIGNPIDEGEIRDDGTRVVDRPIVEPGGPQRGDVVGSHRRRHPGQLLRVHEKRPVGCIEPSCIKPSGIGPLDYQSGEERLLLSGAHAGRAEYPTETRSVVV
jgi:hypothetical protein